MAPLTPRVWFLTATLVWAMVILAGRSFYLQIIHGPAFLTAAEGNRKAARTIPAPRGIIYDVSGKALTENIASTDVVLDPATLPTEENETYLIDRLPGLLAGVTPEYTREVVHEARRGQRAAVLKKAATHEEVLRLEAAAEELPGVRLTSTLVRQYAFGEDLAHVVGYTGPVTAAELASDSVLLPTDITGKTGLEKFYENSLRGKPGAEYVEVNVAGRPQQDLGQKEPVAGSDLHITLDAEFQHAIVELFREEKYHGAAVALDPRDGSIRALVSFPSFDPNVFSQPGLSREAGKVTQAAGQPLFARALDGAYPPGSTIKPFLGAAALEEGVISDATTIVSTGGLNVGVWNFPDWKAGGHGLTDIKKAIAESVNTFFYLATGGDQTHQGLGVDRATAYLKKFGWGTPVAIDVPASGEGFLPSKSWKLKAKGEPWYIGDTYHLGIGQGDVLVTPLQLAAATAALANGTHLVQPHLNIEVAGTRAKLPVSRESATVIREGMRQAVTDGSGKRLDSFPVPLAGKTGTAQVGGDAPTHAWFTSFGPYEAPELVITVLLEQAGEGDDVAVPFTEEIWRWWYENRFRS